MAKNQKSAGNVFGRVVLGSAIMVLMVGTPLFLAPTWAADTGYIRVIGPQGAIDGGSKDAAHLNWISISSVVAGDLNGDAMADRESSSPSVSELTSKPADMASRPPAGKSASDSWSTPGAKSAIGSSASGAGAGKVTASDAASGMAMGKRTFKPFTIMKEIDKSSPLLMQACASGQHIPEVDVQLASGQKYKLSDVIISSDQKSTGGDRPMETISFSYQKIKMD